MTAAELPVLKCHVCGTELEGDDYHDDHEPGCLGVCCRCNLPACPEHCGVCSPRRRRPITLEEYDQRRRAPKPHPTRTVDLEDLRKISLRPAVLYYASRLLREGRTLETVALELKLTPEQIAYVDELTRPEETAS